MLVLDAPLLFFDSVKYWHEGRLAFTTLINGVAKALGTNAAPGGDGAATLEAVAGQVGLVRSAPYSVFVYVTSLTPLGLVGPVLLQTMAVLFTFWALVDRELDAPRTSIALAAASVALLTPLPWFASYLMPDLLAAGVILYAVVLVRDLDDLGSLQKTVLGLVAAFAIIVHYGHIPLAAACIGTALFLRLVRRRLGIAAIVAGLAPPMIAMGANMLAGAVVFDGPSLAPKRLPVLLARSIEDGPARWHLQEHCDTYGYAICTVFDRIPDNITSTMWGEGGLSHASADDLAKIRAEEQIILWRAFREYPVQQTRSLLGNAAWQTVSIGTGDFRSADLYRGGTGLWRADFHPDERRDLLDAFEVLHILSFAAGVIALGMMASRNRLGAGRREVEVVIVLAVGLVANALIFGGLSAPADRYQARIAWLVPAIAALFWLERRRRAHRAPPLDVDARRSASRPAG